MSNPITAADLRDSYEWDEVNDDLYAALVALPDADLEVAIDEAFEANSLFWFEFRTRLFRDAITALTRQAT